VAFQVPAISLGPLTRTGRSRRITLEVLFGAVFGAALLYIVQRASQLDLGITAFDGPQARFSLLVWDLNFKVPLPLWLEFLSGPAGFPVGTQWLTDTTAGSTRYDAFATGVWNTVRVILIGIALATLIGVLAGVGRLSTNWLVRNVSTLYVEVIRNTPLVIQIVFWYTAVFLQLPQIADPIDLFGLGYLSNRGLILPWFDGAVRETVWAILLAASVLISVQLQPNRLLLRAGAPTTAATWVTRGLALVAMAAISDIVAGSPLKDWGVLGLAWAAILFATIVTAFTARRRLAIAEDLSGQPRRPNRTALVILGAGIAGGYIATLAPLTLDVPEIAVSATGIARSEGGLTATPEFFGLLLGLVIYTGAFIAEIVRGGIQALSRGQSEAGMALGLSAYDRMTLVVLPQALRTIIPPLTNQYLNLLKNSSLAAFIAYADLLGVARTIINDIGRAVPLFLMVLITYQLMSWLIAGVMNSLNSRVQLVGR
jgi:general L-amino acid transport system permease protein